MFSWMKKPQKLSLQTNYDEAGIQYALQEARLESLQQPDLFECADLIVLINQLIQLELAYFDENSIRIYWVDFFQNIHQQQKDQLIGLSTSSQSDYLLAKLQPFGDFSHDDFTISLVWIDRKNQIVPVMRKGGVIIDGDERVRFLTKQQWIVSNTLEEFKNQPWQYGTTQQRELFWAKLWPMAEQAGIELDGVLKVFKTVWVDKISISVLKLPDPSADAFFLNPNIDGIESDLWLKDFNVSEQVNSELIINYSSYQLKAILSTAVQQLLQSFKQSLEYPLSKPQLEQFFRNPSLLLGAAAYEGLDFLKLRIVRKNLEIIFYQFTCTVLRIADKRIVNAVRLNLHTDDQSGVIRVIYLKDRQTVAAFVKKLRSAYAKRLQYLDWNDLILEFDTNYHSVLELLEESLVRVWSGEELLCSYYEFISLHYYMQQHLGFSNHAFLYSIYLAKHEQGPWLAHNTDLMLVHIRPTGEVSRIPVKQVAQSIRLVCSSDNPSLTLTPHGCPAPIGSGIAQAVIHIHDLIRRELAAGLSMALIIRRYFLNQAASAT